MKKREEEMEAVRTTIVGGRPPGSGRRDTAVPRGIEVLVKKAAVDEAFRGKLLAERGGAAAVIGLELDPAESAMLGVIAEEQLAGIIRQTVVPAEQRRVFMGTVAAAMLAVLGVGLATAQPSEAANSERVTVGTPNAPLPRAPSGSLYWRKVGAGGGGAGGGGVMVAGAIAIAGAIAVQMEEPIGTGPHGLSDPLTMPGALGDEGRASRGLIVIPGERPAAATNTAPATAPGATRPALDWNDPAAAQRLVQDLCDSDYTVRERGQKVLDAIPPDQYENVQNLAEKATDPEAKARLAARADVMLAQRTLHPPPISLDLKEATLDQVATAFSQALGVRVLAFTPGFYGNERYTISVKDEAFWDIIKDAPFWVSTDAYGDLKILRDPQKWDAIQTFGGVCIAMDGPRKSASAAIAIREAGAPVAVSTNIAIAIDPRLTLTEVRPPAITAATDQTGHPLALHIAAAAASAPNNPAHRRHWAVGINWTQPSDEAAAVTSISVTGTWTLVVPVPDPTSKTGASATKGVTVTVPFDFKHLPVH